MAEEKSKMNFAILGIVAIVAVVAVVALLGGSAKDPVMIEKSSSIENAQPVPIIPVGSEKEMNEVISNLGGEVYMPLIFTFRGSMGEGEAGNSEGGCYWLYIGGVTYPICENYPEYY